MSLQIQKETELLVVLSIYYAYVPIYFAYNYIKLVNLSVVITKILPNQGWLKYQVNDPEILDTQKNIVKIKINSWEIKMSFFGKLISQWLDKVLYASLVQSEEIAYP